MINLLEVNFIALILVVVANTVIGALWYSPLLFGKIWIKAANLDLENFDKDGAKIGYMLTMVAALVTGYVLTLLIQLLETPTIFSGAIIGFLAGTGIAAARELSPTFFESRNMTLYYISAGYHIVALTVMGMIIAAFI
jgi:hypothetical protein